LTISITLPLEYVAAAVTGIILIAIGRLTWRRRPTLVA